jgi:HAD superfamily hydrolase (TIGR01490 family)
MRFFFSKTPVEEFQRKCDAFATEALPQLLRPKAINEIRRLQQDGAEVVIVSASPGNWSEQWRRQFNIGSLATRLQIKDGRLTGRFDGKNCHGEEKVCRINEAYDLNNYDEVYCYGDSKGDKPMLGLATFKFYKPFR